MCCRAASKVISGRAPNYYESSSHILQLYKLGKVCLKLPKLPDRLWSTLYTHTMCTTHSFNPSVTTSWTPWRLCVPLHAKWTLANILVISMSGQDTFPTNIPGIPCYCDDSKHAFLYQTDKWLTRFHIIVPYEYWLMSGIRSKVSWSGQVLSSTRERCRGE